MMTPEEERDHYRTIAGDLLQANHKAEGELLKARAENERLRTALRVAERGGESGYQCARDNAAEIERLREALQLARQLIKQDSPLSAIKIIDAALSGRAP